MCPKCGHPYGKRKRCYKCNGKPRTGESRTCQTCSKIFYLQPNQIVSGEGKFCSYQCKHAAGRVTRTCGTCGKDVIVTASRAARDDRKHVFCNVICRGGSATKPRRGDNKPCEHCGQVFYTPRATPNRPQARFCSKDCFLGFHRARSTEVVCVVCGKGFALKPSQLAFRGGRDASLVCSRDCDRLRRTTNGVGRSHNGREVIRWTTGYLFVWEPEHPSAVRNGWVPEHRWVMEQQLGRFLTTKEHVHHLNGLKDDNRRANLVVLSHSDHSTLTGNERQAKFVAMEAELAEYRRLVGPL